MPQREIPIITLPWPEAKLPSYRTGSVGPWSIERTPAVNNAAGYFLIAKKQPPGWVIKHNGKSIWMSLTKMEVESHLPHLAAAKGHVVIAGLGMGFALYNIQANPNVTKITLIEKNPDIPKLLDMSTNWKDWPGGEKTTIVLHDALTYKSTEKVDFLYADIWPHLGDWNALYNTQIMQKNIQAKQVGYWGQEWDYVSYCQHNKADPCTISYRKFCRESSLPLIEQNNTAYPHLSFAAVILQIATSDKSKCRTSLFKKYSRYLLHSLIGDKIDAEIRSNLLQQALYEE